MRGQRELTYSRESFAAAWRGWRSTRLCSHCSDSVSVNATILCVAQSYISKGIGQKGIGSFCKEFLCFSTMRCRHMPLCNSERSHHFFVLLAKIGATLSALLRGAVSVPLTLYHTGVCEKTLLRKRRPLGKSACKSPHQELERSFCCCFAGQRLAPKECFFTDTGMMHLSDLGRGEFEVGSTHKVDSISLYIYIYIYIHTYVYKQ